MEPKHCTLCGVSMGDIYFNLNADNDEDDEAVCEDCYDKLRDEFDRARGDDSNE